MNRSNADSVLLLDSFDVFTTELCVTFDDINKLRLKYGMGHISGGEYRQEFGKLCRKAHRLMAAWERAGLAKAVLE